MRRGLFCAVVFVGLIGTLAWDRTLAFVRTCEDAGYTVIYVNGVLTEKKDADIDADKLANIFGRTFNGQDLIVKTGHNPSHLQGAADLIQSVGQTFGKPVSNYDFKTILSQIHNDVNTRKILLVGHSQGTFYTNEIYEYLIDHGIPAESIAVYNVATPANAVAGGGKYLTSTNDSVINLIREVNAGANAPMPKDANIIIPIAKVNEGAQWAGHAFQGDYLMGASSRLVGDMQEALNSLRPGDTSYAGEGCFAPPTMDLTYYTQKMMFALADHQAEKIADRSKTAVALAAAVVGTANTAIASISNAVGTMATNLFFTFVPRPNAQTAAAGFSVVNALYGSGVDQETANELLGIDTASADSVSQPDYSNVPQQVPVTLPPPPQSENLPALVAQLPIAIPSVPSNAYSPGFGGGGGTASAASAVVNTPAPPAPPAPLNLAIVSPTSGASFSGAGVTFSGTATADSFVTADTGAASTTVQTDVSGTWTIILTLPEGVSDVDFSADDHLGRTSPTITHSISVDLTAPSAPLLHPLTACARSLSSSTCLIATTTLSVSWDATMDANEYKVLLGGAEVVTTTGTSASITLAIGSNTIEVVAYDAVGNNATSLATTTTVVLQPLIINEIGWAGDDTSANNQWIELKNISSYALDLSKISLARSGGAPIALSGTLPATNGNRVVVQRSNFSFTGSNKIITSFGLLPNSGAAEQLSLVWNDGSGDTILDATPAPDACATWCAGGKNVFIGTVVGLGGDGSHALSMERKLGALDGTLAASWHTTDSYGPYLGAGTNIWGTPGSENSSGLSEAGVYCTSVSNLLTGTPGAVAASVSFDPGGGDCNYLSRFVSIAANRSFGLYRGDPMNATAIITHSAGKTFGNNTNDNISPATTGEHFFFALWERRTFGNDDLIFNFYFSNGASSTVGISGVPHGNYMVIPFTYTP